MSISEDIVDLINKLRSEGAIPKKITLRNAIFERLKFEVESTTNIKVNKDSAEFMGIPIAIATEIHKHIEVT